VGLGPQVTAVTERNASWGAESTRSCRQSRTNDPQQPSDQSEVPIPLSAFEMLRAESDTDPDAYVRPNRRLDGCPVVEGLCGSHLRD
jgi:hypothetical protein